MVHWANAHQHTKVIDLLRNDLQAKGHQFAVPHIWLGEGQFIARSGAKKAIITCATSNEAYAVFNVVWQWTFEVPPYISAEGFRKANVSWFDPEHKGIGRR